MKPSPAAVFLIPFASRQVKDKWDLACSQLGQTLRSIQNSANENFQAVIAGNEPPDLGIGTDSRFHFLSTGLKLPDHPHRGVAVRLDKLGKLDAAWRFAKANFSPRYVIKLDADDFVSRRLVGWLATADAPGYLFQQGWLWRDGARCLIQRTETLDRICGSCLAIRSDLCDLTGPFLTEVEGVKLAPENSQFAARDHYSLVPGSATGSLLLNDSHQRYAAQFACLGHNLPGLPFDAVIYRVGTVSSITRITGEARPAFNLRMFIGKMRRTRFITRRLRTEFKLP